MQMLGGYWYGTGKRKTAIARVFMKAGSGTITVNGKKVDQYFKREKLLTLLKQPLKLVNVESQYDIRVTVKGGGDNGQADAIKYGISKALLAESPERREALKKAGFLRRDARIKERKKYGRPGARKRFQFSKR